MLMALHGACWAQTTITSIHHGEKVFKRCINCHTIEENGGHRYGPNLYGVLGRKVASLPDFHYSDAFKSIDGVWTVDRLDEFLTRPNHAAYGTKMTFRGISNPRDRAALINWLALQGPDTDYAQPIDTLDESLEKGDATRGYLLFRPCTVCHTYIEGEANKIGPNLFGVVGRPIASAKGFHYSEGILRQRGDWTPERLNAFIFESKKFTQGSHIAFQRLIDLSNRADLIAWLKTISPNYRPPEVPEEKEPTTDTSSN